MKVFKQPVFSHIREKWTLLSRRNATVSWLLQVARGRSGAVISLQADVDRRGVVAAAIITFQVKQSPNLARTFLPLETLPTSTKTHGNRTASGFHIHFTFYPVFSLFLHGWLIVGLPFFLFSSFPDSFIDEDPQKALEVNISFS